MKEMITVEKEVYEAVLRNSVWVNDLEKENQQLKDLLGKCRTMLGQFEIKNPEPRTYDVVEILLKIDDAIGGK